MKMSSVVALALAVLHCGTVSILVAADRPTGPEPKPSVLVVVGAPGADEFSTNFVHSGARLATAAAAAGLRVLELGTNDVDQATNDLARLEQVLEAEAKTGDAELWLILIGHGTFDGKTARYNLRGPDLTADQLADWLRPFTRPLILVNAFSSSAPFLNKLSGKNRTIVTATKSGYEQNYSRFGQYFAAMIENLEADLDKDGQVSLLEAFLSAAQRVQEFYKTDGRLVTEHPILDDNGDGLGTPSDWFRGIRATKKAAGKSELDGLRAHQFHLRPNEEERNLPVAFRRQRDELELAVAQLRDQKSKLREDDYYQQLETLLLDLARLNERPK